MERATKKAQRVFLSRIILAAIFCVSTVFMTACANDFNSADRHNEPVNPSIESDLNSPDVDKETADDISQHRTPDEVQAAEAALYGITIHSMTMGSSVIRFEASIDFTQNELMNPNCDDFDFTRYLRIHIESDIEQFDELGMIYSHFTTSGEIISGYFDIGVRGVETSDNALYRTGNINFGEIGSFVLVFSGYGNSEVRIPLSY